MLKGMELLAIATKYLPVDVAGITFVAFFESKPIHDS
jgi:hypothetical protein